MKRGPRGSRPLLVALFMSLPLGAATVAEEPRAPLAEPGGRTVRLVVQIVRADVSPRLEPAPTALALPVEVVELLRRLLRYRSYAVLARADVEAAEAVTSTFEVGADFRVSFRLDSTAERDRVRMREFRVLRRDERGELKALVQTHLQLERGRPMILGMAPTETSERALVVVLETAPELATTEARG